MVSLNAEVLKDVVVQVDVEDRKVPIICCDIQGTKAVTCETIGEMQYHYDRESKQNPYRSVLLVVCEIVLS